MTLKDTDSEGSEVRRGRPFKVGATCRSLGCHGGGYEGSQPVPIRPYGRSTSENRDT
jgi:predicted CxxxxCH...CXXCH cytochrome family protein